MPPTYNQVTIVGGGLAGSEAAWQVAQRGVAVTLYEMRPQLMTPAHQTPMLGELVCSNSLGADGGEQASALLKAELRQLHSLVLRCADRTRVPAGQALAVDRERFAQSITETIAAHPLINLRREPLEEIPAEGICIIATGPLTSDRLAGSIGAFFGEQFLYFFDAVAPIIETDSIDLTIAWRQSRYDHGDAAYLNCPLDRDQYLTLREDLMNAETTPLHEFETTPFFEGCLPIEELARRGEKTMAYGPLKPMGLTEPRTGRRPYAVVQLRPENEQCSLYNMVGFQTRLRWGEQRRIFRTIPGLENAEFARFGVMHRNTFINSPTVLLATFQTRQRPDLLFAGQLTGVEGYVESTAAGAVAGINAARLAQGREPVAFPPTTVIGSLAAAITGADPRHFQPLNANYGLLPPLGEGAPRNKRERRRRMAERAAEDLGRFLHGLA